MMVLLKRRFVMKENISRIIFRVEVCFFMPVVPDVMFCQCMQVLFNKTFWMYVGNITSSSPYYYYNYHHNDKIEYDIST